MSEQKVLDHLQLYNACRELVRNPPHPSQRRSIPLANSQAESVAMLQMLERAATVVAHDLCRETSYIGRYGSKWHNIQGRIWGFIETVSSAYKARLHRERLAREEAERHQNERHLTLLTTEENK